MAELEKNVRAIEKDGLVWGASQFVALGYGIKKLQIICKFFIPHTCLKKLR